MRNKKKNSSLTIACSNKCTEPQVKPICTLLQFHFDKVFNSTSGSSFFCRPFFHCVNYLRKRELRGGAISSDTGTVLRYFDRCSKIVQRVWFSWKRIRFTTSGLRVRIPLESLLVSTFGKGVLTREILLFQNPKCDINRGRAVIW